MKIMSWFAESASFDFHPSLPHLYTTPLNTNIKQHKHVSQGCRNAKIFFFSFLFLFFIRPRWLSWKTLSEHKKEEISRSFLCRYYKSYFSTETERQSNRWHSCRIRNDKFIQHLEITPRRRVVIAYRIHLLSNTVSKYALSSRLHSSHERSGMNNVLGDKNERRIQKSFC